MQHLLQPYAVKKENFAWWEGAFSEKELDWLQNKAKESVQTAQVGGNQNGGVKTEIRRSELNWLPKTEESSWVFERLAGVVSNLNAKYFRFDLTGFGECLQLTNYSYTNQGTYRWHQDFCSEGPSRKLSLVLQLSNPNEYEGGELQLLTSSDPEAIKKQRGLIVVFPSWTIHQVTPVTKGTRQTLVTWISGPEFK